MTDQDFYDDDKRDERAQAQFEKEPTYCLNEHCGQELDTNNNLEMESGWCETCLDAMQ